MGCFSFLRRDRMELSDAMVQKDVKMADSSHPDSRLSFLKWLQPIVFFLMFSILILIFVVNPNGSGSRVFYSLLVAGLLVIISIAFACTLRGKYMLSAVLTVAVPFIGTWCSLLCDPLILHGDMFPLFYVVISIILSGLLFPLTVTIVLAVVQFIALVVIIIHCPDLLVLNWASFFSFVCIISVLSIVISSFLEKYTRQLKESSITDPLTGLFNRRYFNETLDQKISRANMHRSESGNTRISLILLDIDHFKNYNDSFGHAAGDLVLQKFANFLRQEVPLNAVICRYGGDEFAIVIPGTTREHTYGIAQRLQTGVEKLELIYESRKLGLIAISQGIGLFPDNGNTRDELLLYADNALLRAKQQGRNRIVL